MKPNIHPTYFPTATVTCACGASWQLGSTKKDIQTEICSNCHPFYTGKQNLVDTLGRVDRFRKLQTSAQPTATKEKKKSAVTQVSYTQIKAAMKGSKAVKEKKVTGKEKEVKKDAKKK